MAGETFFLKRYLTALPEYFERFPAEVTLTDRVVLHHMGTVVRAKPGERIILVDEPRERAYVAELLAFAKNSANIRLLEALPMLKDHLRPITLAAALIKESHWDWLLQKATELGVRALQPLSAERSVVKLSTQDVERKAERWQMIMRTAAGQSEGLFIPTIQPPRSVAAFCTQLPENAFKLLLAERGPERLPLKAVASQMLPGQSVALAIGPEGGWTDAELACYAEAGFISASLGARILRSETAAIAALSVLLCATE